MEERMDNPAAGDSNNVGVKQLASGDKDKRKQAVPGTVDSNSDSDSGNTQKKDGGAEAAGRDNSDTGNTQTKVDGAETSVRDNSDTGNTQKKDGGTEATVRDNSDTGTLQKKDDSAKAAVRDNSDIRTLQKKDDSAKAEVRDNSDTGTLQKKDDSAKAAVRDNSDTENTQTKDDSADAAIRDKDSNVKQGQLSSVDKDKRKQEVPGTVDSNSDSDTGTIQKSDGSAEAAVSDKWPLSDEDVDSLDIAQGQNSDVQNLAINEKSTSVSPADQEDNSRNSQPTPPKDLTPDCGAFQEVNPSSYHQTPSDKTLDCVGGITVNTENKGDIQNDQSSDFAKVIEDETSIVPQFQSENSNVAQSNENVENNRSEENSYHLEGAELDTKLTSDITNNYQERSLQQLKEVQEQPELVKTQNCTVSNASNNSEGSRENEAPSEGKEDDKNGTSIKIAEDGSNRQLRVHGMGALNCASEKPVEVELQASVTYVDESDMTRKRNKNEQHSTDKRVEMSTHNSQSVSDPNVVSGGAGISKAAVSSSASSSQSKGSAPLQTKETQEKYGKTHPVVSSPVTKPPSQTQWNSEVHETSAENTAVDTPEAGPQEIIKQDTELLEDLGFKEFCEKEHPNPKLTLAFDHQRSRILLTSTVSYYSAVLRHLKNFSIQIAHFIPECIAVQNQLLREKPAAKEFVENALSRANIKNHFKLLGEKLAVYCFLEDLHNCATIVNSSILWCVLPAFDIKTVAIVSSTVCSQDYQDRVVTAVLPTKRNDLSQLGIAATSDVADVVFQHACDCFKELILTSKTTRVHEPYVFTALVREFDKKQVFAFAQYQPELGRLAQYQPELGRQGATNAFVMSQAIAANTDHHGLQGQPKEHLSRDPNRVYHQQTVHKETLTTKINLLLPGSNVHNIKTIPAVEDLFKDDPNELCRDFQFSLSKCNIYIEVNLLLREGRIKLKKPLEKHFHTVVELLKKTFAIKYIDFGEDLDSSLENKIKMSCAKHPAKTKFVIQSKRSAQLVYHCDIEEDLKALFWLLDHKTICIYLPGHLIHCLAHILQHHAKIVRPRDEKDPVHLEITIQRRFAAIFMQCINSILGKMAIIEKQLDPTVARMLQLRESHAFLNELQNVKPPCTVNVQTAEHHLLFQALSPKGHQLMVYKGNFDEAAADILVLPLPSHHTEWPGSLRKVLNLACFNTSAKRYTSDPEFQEKHFLKLRSSKLPDQEIVIIMASWDAKEPSWDKSLEKLLSVERHKTLAIPLLWSSDIVDVAKSAKLMIWDILRLLERMEEGDLKFKLYMDVDIESLCSWISKSVHGMSWAASAVFRSFQPESSSECWQSEILHHVRVKIGQILNEKADVLVNSADPSLKLKKGVLAQLLLEKAGSQLKEQCETLYPNGIEDHVVAVTDCFKMDTFKKCYHIVLHQLQWDHIDEYVTTEKRSRADFEDEILESLKKSVKSCLIVASAHGYRSIVFPALGTGTLQYPPHIAAETMFNAIGEFFNEMPQSTLQDVIICCYADEDTIVQAFKAEEVFYTYGKQPNVLLSSCMEGQGNWFPVTVSGYFMSPQVHMLQILVGKNIPRSADVVICDNSRNADMLESLRQHQGFYGFQGHKDLIEQMTSGFPKTVAKHPKSAFSSIHIATGTFDPKKLQDLMQAVASGFSKVQLHVVLVVPDEEEFNIAINHARKVWKGEPLIKGAGLQKSVQKTASYRVCGFKSTVQEVSKKLLLRGQELLMKAPGAARTPEQGSIETSDDSPFEVFEPEKKPSDLLSIAIPKSRMGSMKLENLLEEFKGEYVDAEEDNLPSPVVRIWIQDDHLDSFARHVREFFSQHHGKHKSALKEQEKSPVNQHHVKSVTKELEIAMVDALKLLMGQEFIQKVSAQHVQNKAIVICQGPTDIMNKIDTLRQEDVQLGESDLKQLGGPWDATDEGVAACFVPVPAQGKMSVYSFDYSAMAKAKHLLNVKLGKVKVTSRGRRRFEGKTDDPGDGASNQSSLGYSAPTQSVDFTTKTGIKVKVYKTDITKLPVDAIVNAANEHLAHNGGVAYAISKAAGFDLEEEGTEYIKRNGPLKVSEVVDTKAGNLPCRAVLHAVGPRWTDFKDKGLCEKVLADTIYNCLVKAESMKLVSLGIPSISSAIFGVPKDVCARSYLYGIQAFDKSCGQSTCVKDIHFVDVNDEMITEIQQMFTRDWNRDLPPLIVQHHQAFGQPQPAGSVPDSSHLSRNVDDAGSQDNHGSAGLVTSSSKVSETVPQKENVHQSPKAELQPYPRLEIIKGSGKAEDFQCQVHFEKLDLVLHCLPVLNIHTEAIVLWQELGLIGKDDATQKFVQHLRDPENTRVSNVFWNLTTADMVDVVEVSSKLFVFPVVRRYQSVAAEKIQELVESSLKKVQQSKKKTVTIIVHPQKDFSKSNKTDVEFATGVYKAVKNFVKRESHSISEVHVVSNDLQAVQLLAMKITEMVHFDQAVFMSMQSKNSSGAEVGESDKCSICLGHVKGKPRSLKCGHTFCATCIEPWLKEKPVCPNCNKLEGIVYGTQPREGRMEMQSSISDMPGYQGAGSLEINYIFNSGVQGQEHPSPGRPYLGTIRYAYLPNNSEGRKVLMLLKVAFDRRIVFTVGPSATINNFEGITWNDIHHKTWPYAGPQNFGYPDEGYLGRVQEELAIKGVTEKDLTDTQKDFIQNPSKYITRKYSDFSYWFQSAKGTPV